MSPVQCQIKKTILMQHTHRKVINTKHKNNRLLLLYVKMTTSAEEEKTERKTTQKHQYAESSSLQ